jgi:UDP-N-acetylmuramate-alanine ligase
MSGYALLAHAWGADVAGWDRAETPYLRHLSDVAVEISPEPPAPPDGWDAYVSTAFAGQVDGRPRADLLAELVSLRRSIVVAGAHGKTTTSAMIAFCRPARSRAGVPHRRRGAAARRQRAGRLRLARRRR